MTTVPAAHAGGGPARGAPPEALLLDGLATLAPALIFVEWRLVGRLFATELILLGLLGVLLPPAGGRLLAPWPRALLALGLLWLCGQAATDLVRATPFEDAARGWSKIAFTLINFAALYLLLGRRRVRFLGFAAGLGLGGLLTFLIHPTEHMRFDAWKFGLGAPVTVLALAATTVGAPARRRGVQAGVALLLCGLHFVLGSRALGAICFLTGVALALRPFLAGRRLACGLVAAAAASCLLVPAYGCCAARGWLGEEARRRHELQSSGRYGVLLGGRPEALASARAILDAPLLGHGSWARDPDGRYIGLLLDARDLGYDPSLSIDEYTRYNLIPTHSYLMGSWVEAGCLGALFWAGVLVLLLRALARAAPSADPLGPLILYFGLRLAWDVPFSPFAGDGRITAPYTLALMIACPDLRPARGGGAAGRALPRPAAQLERDPRWPRLP